MPHAVGSKKLGDAGIMSQQTIAGIITLKIISRDATTLGKMLADLRTRFKPVTASRVFWNPQTREFFAYLNLDENEVAAKLQEISAFPIDTEELPRRA